MRSFKTLKNDFIENRWRILVGLIALLIVDVLQLFIPRVIKYVIDDLTLGIASPYFSHTKVGDLMAHATNDIDAVRMSLSLGIVFLVDTVILGVLTIFFMIYIHPQLTLFALLPMPLITLITLLFRRT